MERTCLGLAAEYLGLDNTAIGSSYTFIEREVAAKELDITERTLRRWIDDKKVEEVVHGSKRLVLLEDIEAAKREQDRKKK